MVKKICLQLNSYQIINYLEMENSVKKSNKNYIFF